MAKSIVTENPVQEPMPPKIGDLMISKNGKVVMYLSDTGYGVFKGIVLSNNSAYRSQGYIADDWLISGFKKLDGSITLTN